MRSSNIEYNVLFLPKRLLSVNSSVIVIVLIIDYEKLQINYHAVNGLSALNVVKVQMSYGKIEC